MELFITVPDTGIHLEFGVLGSTDTDCTDTAGIPYDNGTDIRWNFGSIFRTFANECGPYSE